MDQELSSITLLLYWLGLLAPGFLGPIALLAIGPRIPGESYWPLPLGGLRGRAAPTSRLLTIDTLNQLLELQLSRKEQYVKSNRGLNKLYLYHHFLLIAMLTSIFMSPIWRDIICISEVSKKMGRTA
jgi:hypothetical protein